jgi:hypothetical protein
MRHIPFLLYALGAFAAEPPIPPVPDKAARATLPKNAGR